MMLTFLKSNPGVSAALSIVALLVVFFALDIYTTLRDRRARVLYPKPNWWEDKHETMRMIDGHPNGDPMNDPPSLR
jgi:hypothetical protein